MTNRDFYLFVAALPKATRSLEEYLRALWAAGRTHRDADRIAAPDLAGMLAAALDDPAPAYDPAWEADRADHRERTGFDHWDHAIRAQIVDLHQMHEHGKLEDEYRYFGIDAPSGARWYNFDPNTYLECAVCGTFGGWQEDDATGRIYVPGKVAVFHADGTMTAEDPRSLADPVTALPPLAWTDFVHLLWAGQSYE